jgi:hypothetical protein
MILVRDKISLRKEISGVELEAYHSWANETFFKEVRKPERVKQIREKAKKYGKNRYTIMLD